MRVTDVRINGMTNPMGYLTKDVRVAWKVTETKAKRQVHVKIEAASDSGFTDIVCTREGGTLNAAGECLDLALAPHTRYYIRVLVENELRETAVSETAWFETAKQGEAWDAEWITVRKEDRFHPIFCKNVSFDGEVKAARLYICGLGLFRAKVNGQPVGDEVLTPYYSNYHDEEQYLTFDITEQLGESGAENRIEVALGNGWYKGRFGLAGKSENFGSEYKLIAEIRAVYADGSAETVGTDESWEYYGADTEEDSIYDGEVQNRLLWEGRENPGKHAVKTSAEGVLTARYSLPVKEMEHMPVKEVLRTPAGETVLDFGQNFAGYITFSNTQPKGTKLVFDFGEILQNGNFYNENYRSAKSRFVYISDGTKETVKPQFTFFGFRYVRVTGWQGALRAEDIEGRALYSQMKVTGDIKTGHVGVNRLFSNVMWGQKSNSIDFPTDCPQRDERLGWTGDAQVFSGTASYNMDTAAFYNKFLHDLRTEQKKAGGILPGVIPVFEPGTEIASSVWSDIATFLPTVLYERFGDIRALGQYYPMMKDWVDWITARDMERGQRYLYDFGNQLGDWLALDGRTPQSMEGGTDAYFIGSCYYAMSAEKTANAAGILGKKEEEAYYRALHEKIRQAILREYFTETGRLAVDSQTGYLVALYAGIYREKERVIADFRKRLFKDCYKLKGGFVGAPLMCRIMAENGMEEDAFYFLLQEEYPGWMHCINLDATTIWERWNSVLDNGMLSGTMMNSLNHYAYGSVVEYLYRDVAGLKPLVPGYKKALITPLVNGRLRYMKMSYDSACGMYRIAWEISSDGTVHVRIEVPFGCSAVIALPFFDGKPQEVDAGVYVYDYMPTTDLRCRYTKKTMFKEMLQDEKAMEIIERISPMLMHFLSTGDQDYFHESLESLGRLAFMGFTEQEVGALAEELTALMEDYFSENR